MTIETRVQRLEALAGERHGHEFNNLSDEQLDAEIERLAETELPRLARRSDYEWAVVWERVRREPLVPLVIRNLSDEALDLRIGAHLWAWSRKQGAILIGSGKDQA